MAVKKEKDKKKEEGGSTWPSENPRDEYPKTKREVEDLSKAHIRPVRTVVTKKPLPVRRPR